MVFLNFTRTLVITYTLTVTLALHGFFSYKSGANEGKRARRHLVEPAMLRFGRP